MPLHRGPQHPSYATEPVTSKCYQTADIFVVHDEKLFSGMCKWSNHCLHCCLVNVTMDTILGIEVDSKAVA